MTTWTARKLEMQTKATEMTRRQGTEGEKKQQTKKKKHMLLYCVKLFHIKA